MGSGSRRKADGRQAAPAGGRLQQMGSRGRLLAAAGRRLSRGRPAGQGVQHPVSARWRVGERGGWTLGAGGRASPG